jgi:hypothetical protein
MKQFHTIEKLASELYSRGLLSVMEAVHVGSLICFFDLPALRNIHTDTYHTYRFA